MARLVQHGARLGVPELDLGSQFAHIFWAGDLNYRAPPGLQQTHTQCIVR